METVRATISITFRIKLIKPTMRELSRLQDYHMSWMIRLYYYSSSLV